MKNTTMIDLTPTWSEILPALLLILESGTDTGRAVAIAELKRMALLADDTMARSRGRIAYENRLAEASGL